MKKFLLLLTLALGTAALAQNVSNGPVTKKTSGATINDLNEDLNVNTGRIVDVKGGTFRRTGSGVVTLSANLASLSVTNGANLDALGAVSAASYVLTSGSYADPAWITSLAATKLTGTVPTARLYTTAAGYNITGGAQLDAVAGLASTGLITRTAANTIAARTITGTAGQIIVTNGDGVAGNPTITLPTTITQATIFQQNLTITKTGAGVDAQFIMNGSGTNGGANIVLNSATGGGTYDYISYQFAGSEKWLVGMHDSFSTGGFVVRDSVNAYTPLIMTAGAVSAASFKVQPTTASSSTSTGALVVGNGTSGGLGVGGAIWGGSTLDLAGNATITTTASSIFKATTSDTASASTLRLNNTGASGRLFDLGNAGSTNAVTAIRSRFFLYDNTGGGLVWSASGADNFHVHLTTPATNTANGALVVDGGVGVALDIRTAAGVYATSDVVAGGNAAASGARITATYDSTGKDAISMNDTRSGSARVIVFGHGTGASAVVGMRDITGAANIIYFHDGASGTPYATQPLGPFIATSLVRTSGAAAYFTVTPPADTTLTASTESIGVNFTAGTRQWSTGAITTQRERVFAAPTFSFVGASTVTNAINADFADPIAGTNATFTNTWAIRSASLLVTGNLRSNSATAGIGYATGAGGTVTQATSRTTGVTLNKITGDITLVSAAGTTSWQSFTVTNSAVAATDNVKVDQQSGTDKYMIHVTAVAAGSFVVTYATTAGTTTEQPVFHFSVIKSVNS